MSGEGPSPPPSRIDPLSRTAAALADGLLVFFPALAIVGALRLPTFAGAGEVVSATTRAGFNPLTNYAQFGLCAALVWIAFVLGYRRGVSLLQWGVERLRDRHSRLGWMLVVAVLVVFVINIASSNVTGPLSDGFHEGEYLGFVPMLGQGLAALPSAFTVHGPGVDFLPAYVTARFGDPDHGIVLTRTAYATLRGVAVVASLLVVAALAWLVAPTRWALAAAFAFLLFSAAMQIGSWPDEPALHKPLNARDAGYLGQVFVVLLFAVARRRRPDAPWSGLAAAMVAGASVGWAAAYSYDRGLYGIAFLLLASIAFGLCGWTWLRTWLAGVALGATIGGALLYALVGAPGIEAIASQIAFWMRHGQVIWSYAGIVPASSSWPVALLGGALAVIALAVLRVARSTVRAEIGVVLLLAASLAPLRMAIERADASHVAWAVTPAWILISVLAAAFALAAVARGDEDRLHQRAGPLAPVLMAALSALVGMSLVQMNPMAALRNIDRHYVAGLRTSDRQILAASQAATVDAMADEVRSDACFYTLTNEGTWYYLMRKPSCSRFYQVTNARPIAAQREVVASLQAKAPSLVLFESGGWSNIVDGISLFNASPLVARYVLSHYVPEKALGDNWIWRRAGVPHRFSGKRVGSIVDAPRETGQAWDAHLHGSIGEETPPLPTALFVTDGDDNVPVWAGRPNRSEWASGRWSVTVPTAALEKGRHRLRVWALADRASAMVQLGNDIDLVIK